MTRQRGYDWSEACAELIALLEVGRTITLESVDWRVAGRILATEDGETWAECKLASGSDVRWLSVETGSGVPEVALWRRGEAPTVGFDIERETLDGLPASFVGSGKAPFIADGDCEVVGVEIPASGELVYREYACDQLSARIALEWFAAGPLLVGRGRRIEPPT